MSLDFRHLLGVGLGSSRCASRPGGRGRRRIDWAISFAWWGRPAFRAPTWIEKYGPSSARPFNRAIDVTAETTGPRASPSSCPALLWDSRGDARRRALLRDYGARPPRPGSMSPGGGWRAADVASKLRPGRRRTHRTSRRGRRRPLGDQGEDHRRSVSVAAARRRASPGRAFGPRSRRGSPRRELRPRGSRHLAAAVCNSCR